MHMEPSDSPLLEPIELSTKKSTSVRGISTIRSNSTIGRSNCWQAPNGTVQRQATHSTTA